MLDAENPAENQAAENADGNTAPIMPATDQSGDAPTNKTVAKRTVARKTAAKKTPAAKKTTSKRTTKKVAAEPADAAPAGELPTPAEDAASAAEAAADATAPGTAAKKAAARKATAKKAAAKRTTRKTAPAEPDTAEAPAEPAAAEPAAESALSAPTSAAAGRASAPLLLFQPPEPTAAPARRKKTVEPTAETEGAGEEGAAEKPSRAGGKKGQKQDAEATKAEAKAEPTRSEEESREAESEDETEEQAAGRRRRRRGGRRRRKSGGENDSETSETEGEATEEQATTEPESGEGAAGSRRRRRRRRAGEEGESATDDPENTVTRVRKPRSAEDEITALSGSTRLEAKKQRRREGREAGRRRAPIVSEAEFLARREAVDRVMVIRQKQDLTQIAVLEDKVLVEHYVARESQTSLIGNVYLGRVQNVLPSMEAAFIDIGKGRNAVLYAGEVNWDSLGAKDGQPRKIESVLKSGQSVLVQVTKDPVGHKGARLTSQISLPGRFLVYVPDGTTSGISRKLPDTERNRLKTLLKEIVPDTVGVIVRTAAEGASEEELTRDVERLTARWEDIQGKVKGGNAPQLLYGEPDLTLKVVRDLFTEDFRKLVVSGADAWDMVQGYVSHLAPDLADRLEKYEGDPGSSRDVFSEYRIDEQIAKALDRKVWLPSGGSLVIDRTEAMTVVDVNTGKFTGSGGNLEETVTKNNLEAAEEIVRQLRLRDIGGIIVVDFIDMVLESNRDLVLRRMVECLGRDRTRHQVAEVTSLGLVQMTRKRIGTGLLEAFSESCEHCGGRGLIVHHEPIEPKKKGEEEPRRGRRGRGRGRGEDSGETGGPQPPPPTPKDLAAMARSEQRTEGEAPEGKATEGEAPEAEAVEAAGGKAAEEKPSAGTEPMSAELVEPATLEQPAEAPKGKGKGKPKRREPQTTTHEEVEAVAVTGPPAEGAVHEGAAATAPEGAEVGAGAEGRQAPMEPPAPPKIVTSVRRRGAVRRPAGPPPGASASQQASDGVPADGAQGNGPAAGARAAGTDEVATGSTDNEAVVEPAAGVVSGNGGDSDSDSDSDAAEDQLPLGGEEPAAAAHVPIKKKGSRKR